MPKISAKFTRCRWGRLKSVNFAKYLAITQNCTRWMHSFYWNWIWQGVIIKFCNSVWCTTDSDNNYISFFYVITLHINTFVTFVKKFLNSSKIEFLRHAVEIWLGGLFELIIITKPCCTKVLLQMTKLVEVARYQGPNSQTVLGQF